MKKVFLTLAVSLMALASTAQLQLHQLQPLTPSADSPFKTGQLFSETGKAIKASAPLKAEGETTEMDYAPSGNRYDITGLQNQKAGMKMAQALQITNSATQKFGGNNIYKFYFFTGYNVTASQNSYVNTIKEATVFLTYDLKNFDPFYTQTVELSSNGLEFTEVILDTPYLIEAGKPVYIGYYYTLSAEDDGTLVYDYINHGNDVSGGWYGAMPAPTETNPNPTWTFNNASQQLGFFCIGVGIKGTKMPQNEMSASALDIPVSTYQNTEFEVSLDVENTAANTITSFEVEVQIGEQAAKKYTFNEETTGGALSIPYGYGGTITLSELSYDTASKDAVPVTVTVTKVNGEDNNSTAKKEIGSILILPEGKGFPRNIVIEEFTGTWCPNCPQGIVTMEKLRETYTDGSVIPIAIHNNDAMVAQTYSTIENKYATVFPSAVLNRTQYATIYPPTTCIEEIEALKACPTTAQVTATANFTDDLKNIVFKTKTTFTFDETEANNNYSLAFGVIEDNVGPYEQLSNFTPSGYGKLDGWNYNTSKVKMYFNDVARQYNAASKSSGAIPENVEAGKEYEYEYTMAFRATTQIQDHANLYAVVYLLNRKTGSVINAYMLKASEIGGVNEVVADSEFNENAPVEYFNLQGMRIAQPESGLYIVRQGNNAKVVRAN